VARFRNVSGFDLFIVALGKTVEDDGVFDVPDAEAPGFECQPDNYARQDEPAKAKKASI